jgi:hypothetical protein
MTPENDKTGEKAGKIRRCDVWNARICIVPTRAILEERKRDGTRYFGGHLRSGSRLRKMQSQESHVSTGEGRLIGPVPSLLAFNDER